MLLNIRKALKNPRLFKALTGCSPVEFYALCIIFKQVYENFKKEYSKSPAGRRLTLFTVEEQLFFILFYVKVYPTFDVAAFIFGVDRSSTCRWAHRYLTILEECLGHEICLPQRKLTSPEELFSLFPGLKEVFFDVTERPVRRPCDEEAQKEKYSGKKKRHTIKNLAISDDKKRVLFLSGTAPGKVHDYSLLKEADLGNLLSTDDLENYFDLGFQGVKKDYPEMNVNISS